MSYDDVVPAGRDAREWWPLRLTSPPFMRRYGGPIEVAQTYVVAEGPELLRAADANDERPFLPSFVSTLSSSALRRPADGKRFTSGG
jgi:hypothetical protein